MRAHKIRQRDLFDGNPEQIGRALLPEAAREEVLRLLTRWLHALSKSMAGENRDEQDLL